MRRQELGNVACIIELNSGRPHTVVADEGWRCVIIMDRRYHGMVCFGNQAGAESSGRWVGALGITRSHDHRLSGSLCPDRIINRRRCHRLRADLLPVGRVGAGGLGFLAIGFGTADAGGVAADRAAVLS